MTLVELLIVCFILVLAVAIAAPLLRPNTADRKTREAARQIHGFLSEAKAYAAQRGRPVGVAFDRGQAADEGARDPSIVTRLYLAESPPTYAGDTLDATLILTRLRREPTGGFDVCDLEQPPWYDYLNEPAIPPPPGPMPLVPDPTTVVERHPSEINGFKANWYEVTFAPATSAMLRVICASYIKQQPAYRFVPLRMKLNGQGGYFEGYCWYTGTADPPDAAGVTDWRFFLWEPVGRGVNVPPLLPGQTSGPKTYQVEFPPMRAGDYALELPTGTVVDLRYSGYGPRGVEFGSGGTDPIILTFDPGGYTDRVFGDGTMANPPMKMHFLVSTAELAIEGLNHQTSSLSDASNQWVSVNAGQGTVTTANNTPPSSYADLPTAVSQARSFAVTAREAGGR
jgi:type II secretory pathway pseudopilin PulG